ncbi:angiopoietin-4-like [Anopheles ziemanni]|uniref:angiopoietin-4-like n=1 Tax=Anopheles coustani TaxID=139045 RepID=UPI002658E7FB|nr:angiopoietin-4-like [Anopheles coustani]XP_058177590.1 angiopoietin-4-like [Anopheles ziemanni]
MSMQDNAIATKVKDEALQNTLTSLIFVLDNKLIAKISNLQRKLDVLERTIQDENDAVRRRDESLQSKINAMEISLKTRSDTLMEVLLGMKTAMTTAASMLKMNSTSIHLKLKESVNQQKQQDEGAKIFPQTTLPVIYQSCMEEPTKVSGKYAIQLQKESQKLISVYCEQSAHGGGWIVFQHRFNGKEDFYRNWADYRDGFGSLDGEFWLGLESLHQLTSSRKHELMVEVNDTRGNYGYARYDHFEIGDESEKFKLKIVGRSKGTARDTLKQRLGDKFTTKDEDND